MYNTGYQFTSTGDTTTTGDIDSSSSGVVTDTGHGAGSTSIGNVIIP